MSVGKLMINPTSEHVYALLLSYTYRSVGKLMLNPFNRHSQASILHPTACSLHT